MPRVMGLDGQRQRILDDLRGQLYGAMPRPFWRAQTQLEGALGAIFDPLNMKWFAIGGFILGMWLSSSPTGKKLVAKYVPKGR